MQLRIIIVIGVIFITALWLVFAVVPTVPTETPAKNDGESTIANETIYKESAWAFLAEQGLTTDTSRSTIAPSLILPGGPGKDGIPAINDPSFISLANTTIAGETRGIFVDIHGIRRFYPYSILVWHEIVNDTIGQTPIAVTFCPLCDSGVVFDRQIGGKTLRFGVSGFLYESNLLMYDAETESLWSQARLEALVGEYTGTTLAVLPLQVITLDEVREKYPDTEVMSANTGFERDYTHNPYAGYRDTEETIFPVSITDKRFPAKEIMYVIPLPEHSVALPYRRLSEGTQIASIGADDTKHLTITRSGGEVFIENDAGRRIPGYFEMWFSWATHHQNDGIVLEVE